MNTVLRATVVDGKARIFPTWEEVLREWEDYEGPSPSRLEGWAAADAAEEAAILAAE